MKIRDLSAIQDAGEQFIVRTVLLLFTVFSFVYASKVTVDADGGADYTSLDAVLTELQAGSIDPDTIEFIGSDQDTYSWNTNVYRKTVGTLLIRSTQTAPDLFPIMTRNADACWDFMQNTNVYFENIIFSNNEGSTDPYAWTNAQSSGLTLSFKKCVIKDQSTDYFLKMEGDGTNTTIFENCLFEGNAKIFTFDYFGGTPTITMTNCTFDANTELFSADLSSGTAVNVSFSNCIYSNNTATFPSGGVLKGKATYSLTSESTSGYGTNCVSNSNPQYIQSTRNNPSDWGIASGSPAENISNNTGAPSTDISGTARSGTYDAGCWEVGTGIDYTWDTDAASGITPGDGTWGSDDYWTETSGAGTSLIAWPGAGNSATFAGADGTYAITVSGTRNVDGITFSNSGYTLSGGTAINFGTKNSIAVASGKSGTIATPITGSGGIALTGGGTLIISGTGTYTGTTTISDGTFQIGAGSTSGAISNSSPIANSGTLTFDRSDDYSYSGVISGAGAIVKEGAGTVTLSGNLTHTGLTTVNDGTLRLTGTPTSNTRKFVITSGGTISVPDKSNLSATPGSLISDWMTLNGGTLSTGVTAAQYYIAYRGFVLDASGGTIDIPNTDNSNTVIIYGIITGSGALTKTGVGTLALAGDNTFTGTTTISAGTLQIGAEGSAGSIASTSIVNNSALAFNRSDAYTYSGAISGSGSVTQQGTGALTLSGTNTYTGATTVSSDTLLITGSTAAGSAVSVSSGATLGGSGTIGGTVNVTGTLAPGDGEPGTLTIGSDLTFAAGSEFVIEANGTTAGSGYDRISQTGSVSLGGNATLSFSLGYAADLLDSFVIIDNDGADAVSGTFDGIPGGSSISVNYSGSDYTCEVLYTGGDGNDVVVTVTSVEETSGYGSWAYWQSIYLNTTATGANVSGDVSNFPVLLRLNPGNFYYFNQTQPEGADIRFATNDGTELSYQIEAWKDYDNNLDTAIIWVKIPTVYGNNKTQSFRMYWGKNDAADSSNGAAVFDTGNGFVGVWHLNEDPSGSAGAGAIKDATINALNATTVGGMTSGDLVSGQMYKGHTFDNTDNGDSIPYTSKLDISSALTITAWIKPVNTTNDYDRICSKSHTGDSDPWNMYSLNFDGSNHIRGELNISGSKTVSGNTSITAGTFSYAVFTYSGDSMKVFLNGTVDGGVVQSGVIGTNSQPLTIGKSAYRTNHFNGVIDEVTLSKTARSANWIKLCYENQKTSQTLVSLEDYSTWGFSRNITINTSGITTTNCVGFPLLVRLTGTTFDFNQARDSGQDIRFAKSNGVSLAYQIERWNKASSLAEIWVRVDTIYGSNSSQYITMYWGKNGVSSKSNGTAVFDTTNGFVGVWHLGEVANSTADGYADATNNAAHGQGTNLSSGNEATAVVGRGQTLQYSSSRYITVKAASEPKFDITSALTVSTWINVTSWNIDWQAILTKGDASWRLHRNNSNGTINFSCTGLATNTGINGSTTLSTGTWYYVTGVYDGGHLYMYLNGVSDATSLTATGSIATNNYNVTIGHNAEYAGRYFNGVMDEVRVEKSARSADWVKLCYYTQKSDASVLNCDSADAFRPLTIRRHRTGSVTDSIIIATKRWGLRFAANKGGGIDFLAPDTNSGVNQLDKNLFYLVLSGTHSSDTGTGTLSLEDSSVVFARVRQLKTLDGQPFTIDYTVLGSGRLLVRVSGRAAAALSGGLEFRIANNAAADVKNIRFGTSAASCKGLAHIDSTDDSRFDLIMAPYDVWSAATDTTSDSKYAGLKSTTWSCASGSAFAWEFMVDFAHRTLTDSAAAYRYVADYRNSDTLGFYAGTPLLEQAWEMHEKGQWSFDEDAGSTAADLSGNGHTATLSGTPSWTTGKWFTSAVRFTGSDYAAVNDHVDFGGGYAHTFMAWVKPSATLSATSTILEKFSSGNVGYKLTGTDAGKLLYTIGGSAGTQTIQSTAELAVGTWSHVAAQLVAIGGTNLLRLYINGKLDTIRSFPDGLYIGTNSEDVIIGNGYNGVTEDVRFYNDDLSDQEIRAIYLKGFSPDKGMYSLRADNNNTVHCRMHGNPYSRYLPVVQVDNYWATDLPQYVYIDGVSLTEDVDYYAALDDGRNRLTIGFNRVVNGNTAIYIDDNYQHGNKCVGATKKMYWGIEGAGNQYFWVKNTSGRYFGAASANEFYINWKMSESSANDGEIWKLFSSVTNPSEKIDTASCTNIVPGSPTYGCFFGNNTYSFSGSDYFTTARNVYNSFTYAVVESSQVRVRLQINSRKVERSGTIDSLRLLSRWTLYPTGQFFRYDSIWNVAGDGSFSHVQASVYIADGQYTTPDDDGSALRGGIINSQTYPDIITAWLSMRNNSGPASAFTIDYMTAFEDGTQSGVQYFQYTNPPTQWDDDPVQSCYFVGMMFDTLQTSSIASISESVQNQTSAISMTTGTLTTNSAGDLNTDGFNETEGAYIMAASNNTIKFQITASAAVRRYFPAFRITDYTATSKPQYIFIYTSGVDTAALLEGYQYNCYLKQAAHELIIQLDTILFSDATIYISADNTLAVKMSLFDAIPGDNCDTVIWRTESENENLGYRLLRRINPEFFDSMMTAYRDSSNLRDSNASGVRRLVKRRLITTEDTGWTAVNSELIPGTQSGLSHGPRDYRYVDKKVYNDVMYEYRLIAVDFHNGEEEHGPVAVTPRHVAPVKFLLGLNYPNPFRYATRIRFSLPVETAVTLNIYTLRGQLVRHLIRPDRILPADRHQVLWDGSNDQGNRVAAGPYIYRMSTRRFVKAKMMLMVR